MTDPITPTRAKALARELAAHRKAEGTPIKHSQALEEIARQHGYRDFNTLVGENANQSSTKDPSRPGAGKRPFRLVVEHQKGGSGATTLSLWTAVLVAEGAHPENQQSRTVLVDLDPQASLSRWILGDGQTAAEDDREGYRPPAHPDSDHPTWSNKENYSSSGCLFTEREICPYPTPWPNVDVLPAERRILQHVDIGWHKDSEEEREDFIGLIGYALEHAFGENASEYDLVIFDLPPGDHGILRHAAFAAADGIISAISPERAVDPGSLELRHRNATRKSRDPDEREPHWGIAINHFNSRTKMHQYCMEQFREHPVAENLMCDPIRITKMLGPQKSPPKGPIPGQVRSTLGVLAEAIQRWMA